MSAVSVFPALTEPLGRSLAHAPLVPVALAATVGLLVDRYCGVPQEGGVLAAVAAFVGWFRTRMTKPAVACAWLLLGIVATAALYHGIYRQRFAPDDISYWAQERPQPIRLRGRLAEEPERFRPPRFDPLLTVSREAISAGVIDVSEVEAAGGWQAARGRVQVWVPGRWDDVHCGDAVEIVGQLVPLEGPLNPGQRDHRAELQDRRIHAEVRVRRGADAIVRLDEKWHASLFGWLATVRGWGRRVLERTLPDESGLAAALLLGDSTALDRDEWEVFLRTGVIHVLAISGQHLVILGAFLWLVLRLGGVRRQYAAAVVAGFLLAYALLTGARPSAVRAAVMVVVASGGLMLRRPVHPANTFACAALVVLLWNPTDLFTPGFQLSFLSVFVLIWGVGPWLAPRPPTPAEQLIEETRSLAAKTVRTIGRAAGQLLATCTLLTAVNTPLVLAWQNVVSPVAVLLGPPLVVLTAAALVTGFVLLMVAPWSAAIAWPFARLTEASLAACTWLVEHGEQLPFSHFYAPAPPWGWLVGFYLGILGVIVFNQPQRRKILIALLVWTIIGLVVAIPPRPSDEARVAFLAIGHGGCVVIECPDGRVLLYDAGTTIGPPAVRRIIAPYLWHRGVWRIDEIFLSHADVDHFNGLPELLRRFPVGRVTTTPSFATKDTPGVEAILTTLEHKRVPRNIVRAGDRLSAGAEVRLDVLHPPQHGPPGSENARSMVLLLHHAHHTILLTGDLEGEGQDLVVQQPIPPVDVFLAPHHGAYSANAPGGHSSQPQAGRMAAWAKPRLVISSQRPGAPTEHLHASYGAVGAKVWDTPHAGAVIIRSHKTGLIAEAYRTGERFVITRGQ
ncbi:MAG: ComEC/Rec2 family competence protein [Gemmataceae bacterium]|nr:ComEC/Rec2 family competence protein [Gemmata sp.]MDW8198985.1 ComEC/Rec2 family competence protein [Gemmataceae bacterium]